MTSLESIEEYVEVTAGKKFMSSSDLDSIKGEDLESVHVENEKKFKQEKRKILIDEDENEGYLESDSMVNQ